MKQLYCKKIVLLLTGTINTNGISYVLLNDKTIRKKNYIDAIKHYLQNYNYPIVFVENSDEDLSPYFVSEIKEGRLQILHFNGNDYQPILGKGYGEMGCIEYAVKNATLINKDTFIFKITGRYIINNAAKFFNTVEKKPALELLADLTNNFTWSAGCIFGFTPYFANTFLFKNKELLNDSIGYNFEHALAKAVLEAIGHRLNFQIFNYYPIINAISGTTGKYYNKAWWYIYPRQLKYFVRYLIVIR